MKNVITTVLGICLISLSVLADDNQKGKLTVVVKNLQNKDGKVSVSLFNSEGTFLNDGVNQRVNISTEGQATVVFENVSAGTYAVSVIHDVNDNGDLDTGTFGIPTEAYGFSNDARGMFGPASFEDSKFTFLGNKKIEINIK